jgi:hypothetical protein
MSDHAGPREAIVIFDSLIVGRPAHRMICPACGHLHTICLDPSEPMEPDEFPIIVPMKCLACRISIRAQFNQLAPGQPRERMAAASDRGRQMVGYLENLISRPTVAPLQTTYCSRPELHVPPGGHLLLEPQGPTPHRGLLQVLRAALGLSD